MNKDYVVVIEHLRDEVEDITYLMLAAAQKLSTAAGGRVIGLLLGHNAENLAEGLPADQIVYIEHPVFKDFTPDGYLQTIQHYLGLHPTRLVIFGHTTIGMDIASRLALRLSAPLLSQALTLQMEGDNIEFTGQICGGKILVDGSLPEPLSVVSMIPGGYASDEIPKTGTPDIQRFSPPTLEDIPTRLRSYIEPEATDVDISKEAILIGIGRGLKNEGDMELIEELAEAIQGTLCASRPVVDQGWLPTTRLVGKSGQTVKPDIYLALGISGAPEHVQGMIDSSVIVAVNTDSTAPIFDIAHYGTTVDMLDLVEAIQDQLKMAETA